VTRFIGTRIWISRFFPHARYPPSPSNSSSATFGFSCNQPACTFECQMDSPTWSACASPAAYTGLIDGQHEFYVRAMVGTTVDPTPAGCIWTIDTVPPTLTIVQPQDGATTNTFISINISYSDSLSGVDLDSLLVYHNDTDITASLSKGANSATGSRTGTTGGNVFNAWISDLAGNQSFDSALVLIEDGAPPVITIVSPEDGASYQTNTIWFSVEYYDLGSSVDLSTLKITIDGVDRTSEFTINSEGAEWYAGPGDLESGFAAKGADSVHTMLVEIKDTFGNLANELASFTSSQTVPAITLTSITPNFTIGGDTVTIVGSSFGGTVEVYFSGTHKAVYATVSGVAPGSTHFDVQVPGSAITGEVFVKSRVSGVWSYSTPLSFTCALPYAYITSRSNHKGVRFDYRTNSVLDSFTVTGTSPSPWAVDITPDGRYAFIANYGNRTVTVVGTHNNNIVNTVSLQCGATPYPSNPRAIAISPDGSRAFVASNNKFISVLEIRKVLAGNTCSAVSKKSYTYGTNFYDIAFTLDGNRAVIPARGNPGIALEIRTNRYYISDANSNTVEYLYGSTYNLGGYPTADTNPSGVAISPKMVVEGPWSGIIVNNGVSPSNTIEHSALVLLPNISPWDIINTMPPGLPTTTCTRGFDAAISNLGERAFINFQSSSNIGVTGLLDGTTAQNNVLAATKRCSSSNTTGCPCPAGTCDCIPQKIVYTPYLNKILATIYWTTQANSKIMILDASSVAIAMGDTGTIDSSHYTCISHSSLIGPQGIAVQPLFDRDGDKISDLIEYANIIFHPTSWEAVASGPQGSATNGQLNNGILLPEEGIGYRHTYVTTRDYNYGDNYGTLRMIQIIEAVGREWNLAHPSGPRMTVLDLSLRNGGQFYPPPLPQEHSWHQQGVDADLRYARTDGAESAVTVGDGSYSSALSQEIVRLFCKAGVERIIISENSNIIAPGCNLVSSTTHGDHFHVRIN